MKIGVLLCAYSLPEYIPDCLAPWVEARARNLGGHTFVISAISVPFKEYKGKAEEDLESPVILQGYKDRGEIDYLFTTPKWEEEKVVRNTALNPLLEDEKCDIIILVDCDENYILQEIEKIFKFVENNPFTVWFRGSLKNYIFDLYTYLKDPFCPARIYRVNPKGLKLYGFRFDNEMVYIDEQNRVIDHLDLPSLTIPKNIAWTVHKSWLSNSSSRDKTLYQALHFGPDFCSYRWNEEENKLEFNPNYFKKFGKTIPEVVVEK
jgi:hypothetical protein